MVKYIREISRKVIIFLSVFIAAGFFTANASAQDTREQYFIFSHQFHIKDIGVDCIQCHGDVVESRLSSDRVIPGHTECFECHDGDFARDDCSVCHYDEENIQLSPSPKYEYLFNHELHIGLDEVDCSRCHAGIEEADYASAEHMPEMENCVQCHNNAQAPQNCGL